MLCLALLRVAISIASIAFSFAEQNASGVYYHTRQDFKYSMTLDSYYCQINPYLSSTDAHLSKYCHESRVGRWLMIPYLVISIVLVALSIFSILLARRMRSCQELPSQTSQTFGEWF
ncbi:hypothetical protein AKO1_007529 [Acrasis kona]|uniref:Uncharacterized protein n=1 Tax=Acrasis kona TaxID=1008807 RepID=A0AAW2YRX3_9EUKA